MAAKKKKARSRTTRGTEPTKPASRVRARAAKGAKSTARRGGVERKQGTVREDKRSPSGRATEKNLREDHDKATHELEASHRSKRPSRKSTRRGANRMKPDSQLKRRTTRALRSPQSRHAMRGG